MEDFEEMKLYWNQLAEKNNVDSETNKKILEAIRKNQYKSYVSTRIKECMISMILIVALMIFLLLDRKYHTSIKPFHIVTFTTIETAALLSFIGCFFEILILQKLDFSAGVTVLRERVRFYKKWWLFNYCFGYVMGIVIIAVLAYFENWNNPPTIAIYASIFVIIITGCFMYLNHKREVKQVKQLEEFIDDEE